MYLNCHSYYSLRYGTFSEESLIELALLHNAKYIALTDINSTSAVLNFLRLCQQQEKIHPIVGVDIRNGMKQEYVLIAKNNDGYTEINTFLTYHLHSKTEFPLEVSFSENVYVIYPFEKLLEMSKARFNNNEFIGIGIQERIKIQFSNLYLQKDKIVLCHTVSFRNKSDYNAHRLLRSIDLNILLSQLPETEQGSLNDVMHSHKALEELFENMNFVLENTKNLAQNCSVSFAFGSLRVNQNQQQFLNDKEEDFKYLTSLCNEKIYKRYPHPSDEVYARIEKELTAIKAMNFVSYFLINYDIVSYAKSKDYPYIGRGSGANSIVAYIIGITNVDPIELDLYFERFINIYRDSPPDFDIDFSWKDRDDVTRYIFERFPNTSLMGTYVTFQYRAVIRELGKVFGLPKAEIDGFIKYKRYGTTAQSNSYLQLIEKYSHLIHGMPNYISVHAGGILILNKDINYYTATFMPPKGFRTVLFDMNIAEDVGIYKFDILAQRGLSKIKDTLEIVSYNQPDVVLPDMEDTTQFKEDPAINNLLKVGDCMGVFYVESPAMRGLMTKLQTQDYLGLVAASSIIRPGVSNGGMKNEYILRHRDPKRRDKAHPTMLNILHETHGVLVYQEDVLKVAHEFAGLDLSEADILRRGMRGKVNSKGQFVNIEEKFIQNCLAKGYTEKLTMEVWNQVKAFAGYAFAKGHSASYAVESYQSLYLKKYYPLEFMTAVLNNGGGFYNIETYLHEITMCGGTVHNPCINLSDHANVIYGKKVYLGLGMIHSLEKKTIARILSERQLYGNYTSLEDLVDRVAISLEQLTLLIRINAFRFTGKDKHNLMWKAHFLISHSTSSESSLKLFKKPRTNYAIPSFSSNYIIDAYDEMELLGFPLCSYFDLLEAPPLTDTTAEQLPQLVDARITIYGKLVSSKGTKTTNNKLMQFGTFLDQKGRILDTVHFPKVVQKFSIRANGVYMITGKVSNDLGYYSIIVESIHHQAIVQDPRYANKNLKAK